MLLRPMVVVLATGHGTRLGGITHELTQSFGSSTVLGTTLSNVLSTHLPVVVVTVPSLAAVAKRWVAARDVVLVPEAGGGDTHPTTDLGVAIATAVAARPHAPGWLVLPAELPQVQPTTLLAVASALALSPVAYAQYRGQQGQPVGFSAELYSELITLTTDEGARRLLVRYPAVGVEVADAAVLTDGDAHDDRYRQRLWHTPRPSSGDVDRNAPTHEVQK